MSISQSVISKTRFADLPHLLCAVLWMTGLFASSPSDASYVELYNSGTVTLTNVKAGRRVILNVEYLVPDPDDPAEGETIVTSALVTAPGNAGQVTVNAQNLKYTFKFVAAQDNPVVNVSMSYIVAGPPLDNDEGGVALTW